MMHVAIMGGGATSTPSLFRALAAGLAPPRLHLSLHSRNLANLEVVATACHALLAGTPVTLSWHTIGGPGWERSLHGASVVVLQVRVGGYAGRAFDESFPIRYGVCGDEGLGPGGLSAAWRAWPYLAPYFEVIQRVTPTAQVIVVSSPVGILVRAAGLHTPRLAVRGICELPWTTLMGVGRRLGADPCSIDFDYYGINHIGWFYRIQVGSRDLLNEYQLGRIGADDFPSPAIIASCCGLPTKYLRLHYEADRVLMEQRPRVHSRADFLSDYKLRALPVFRTGDPDRICAVLDERPAEWYSYALAPLLLTLTGRPQPVVLFLTERNQGFAPNLRDDDVLEIPHTTTGTRLSRRLNESPVPEPIADLVRRFVKYERVATRAIVERNQRGLVNALNLHPWIPPGDVADRMAREIVEASADTE